MQRYSSLLVVGALGVALLVGPVSIAAAAPSACAPTVVNAAIGIPGETINAKVGAGAVEVRYSCGHATQLLHLPTPHAGDAFGTSSRLIDWNADGYADLVAGVPGYSVGSATHAGAIAIFYGSAATGLSFGEVLTQSTTGVPGAVQRGAHFGAAVATWEDYTDDYPYEVPRRIRVGEPGKDVDGNTDAGGFVDLIAGWSGHASHEVTLDTAGYPATAQRGDALGSSLSNTDFIGTDLIGAPGRMVTGHAAAGAVLVAGDGPSGSRFISQNTPCMPGVPETGDRFGAAVAGSWIGVPGEDIGSRKDAGMVERWDPARKYCAGLTQDSPGVGGSPETGDRFGAALGELYSLQDDSRYVPGELLIGVPGEDTSYGVDTGLVNEVSESVSEIGALTLTPCGSTAGPEPRGRAAFGSAFGGTLLYRNQALISAPGGAGAVYNYRLTSSQSLALQATYHQSVGQPVAGAYGVSLSSSTYQLPGHTQLSHP